MNRIIVAAATAAIVATVATATAAAVASTSATNNPWTFTMTNPNQNGLVIHGNSNQALSAQSLEVFDGFGNPIFSIPPAGGPAVYGDNFRVTPPGDVFNYVVRLNSD